VDAASEARTVELLHDPRVVAAVGLHPWYLSEDLDEALAFVDEACDRRRVVAIGETGLDKGRRAGPMGLQRRAFGRQLEIAAARRLPVILHVVRTHGACIAAARAAGVRGMVHDFRGPTEVVRDWIDAGFFLSVSPGGLGRTEAIRAIPGERLLIETDDEGHERLPGVCAEVARIRGVPVEDVATTTAANARRLFGFGSDPRVETSSPGSA
jgi:TatD DNase family protein